MRKCINQNELDFYIQSLKDYYGLKSDNYDEIIKKC